jgi:hypothetical protein
MLDGGAAPHADGGADDGVPSTGEKPGWSPHDSAVARGVEGCGPWPAPRAAPASAARAAAAAEAPGAADPGAVPRRSFTNERPDGEPPALRPAGGEPGPDPPGLAPPLTRARSSRRRESRGISRGGPGGGVCRLLRVRAAREITQTVHPLNHNHKHEARPACCAPRRGRPRPAHPERCRRCLRRPPRAPPGGASRSRRTPSRTRRRAARPRRRRRRRRGRPRRRRRARRPAAVRCTTAPWRPLGEGGGMRWRVTAAAAGR